jgi:hypothetical protein
MPRTRLVTKSRVSKAPPSPHVGAACQVCAVPIMLLRGAPPTVARRTAGDMPLPPDFRQGYTSIYELQTETKRQS